MPATIRVIPNWGGGQGEITLTYGAGAAPCSNCGVPYPNLWRGQLDDGRPFALCTVELSPSADAVVLNEADFAVVRDALGDSPWYRCATCGRQVDPLSCVDEGDARYCYPDCTPDTGIHSHAR